MAIRPFYHLEYPVVYLSHPQRILPTVRRELYFIAAHAACLSRIQGMHAAKARTALKARNQGQASPHGHAIGPRPRQPPVGTQVRIRHAAEAGRATGRSSRGSAFGGNGAKSYIWKGINLDLEKEGKGQIEETQGRISVYLSRLQRSYIPWPWLSAHGAALALVACMLRHLQRAHCGVTWLWKHVLALAVSPWGCLSFGGMP